MMIDKNEIKPYVDEVWETSIIPELTEYIRIPNKSPDFDSNWQQHGYMEEAVNQFVSWAEQQDIAGLELEVVRIEDRTPLLFMDIPGTTDNTILLYGHLDKQPEMTGWRDDLGPWEPVLEGDKLYGRGGADDGYAMFASLLAIKALQIQQLPHSRCVVIIEACEESGSYDLPHYIDVLADRIGSPELVICLDSGCGNYDQLWNTTSLRGLVGGNLKIDVLDEGVHSGDASGIVPSSFLVMRELLDRIDKQGNIVVDACHVEIPPSRLEQAKIAADILGNETWNKFPFAGQTEALTDDPVELVLNRTWRPSLAVTGMDGVPALHDAGNVLRPMTAVKLSLRLPPTCDASIATARIKEVLETDPPYGANVEFVADWDAEGWHAPQMEQWLEQAIEDASQSYFGKPAVHMGEGGTIPFMGMLGEKFPSAQFLITGVLGPHSNAHGPNEFLHIPTAKRLTCCVAEIISSHFEHVNST